MRLVKSSGEPAMDFLLRLTWIIHQNFDYRPFDFGLNLVHDFHGFDYANH